MGSERELVDSLEVAEKSYIPMFPAVQCRIRLRLMTTSSIYKW